LLAGLAGMRPADLAALLRLKQVREQLASAALSRAMQAERRATESEARAATAAAAHAARRALAQDEIYARLLAGGPLGVRQFQGEAARLAGMAAQAGILAQRRAAAEQSRVAAAGETQAARVVRSAAQREAEAAALLRGETLRHDAVRDERAQEAEIEEIAARLRSPS